MVQDQRERHMKKVASTNLSTGSGESLHVGIPEPSVGNYSQL